MRCKVITFCTSANECVQKNDLLWSFYGFDAPFYAQNTTNVHTSLSIMAMGPAAVDSGLPVTGKYLPMIGKYLSIYVLSLSPTATP